MWNLVGHRGHPAKHPENTLAGVVDALRFSPWFEVDLQMTADRQPILFHDGALDRMLGDSRSVWDVPLAEIQTLPMDPPTPGVSVASLLELCQLLNGHPQARGFLELKSESADQFGVELFVERVLHSLNALGDPNSVAALISKDLRICQALASTDSAVGWVLPEWTDESRQAAHRLAPKYLFCNRKRLPESGELWDGAWDWGIYTVNDPAHLRFFCDRQVAFIETDRIEELVAYQQQQFERRENNPPNSGRKP